MGQTWVTDSSMDQSTEPRRWDMSLSEVQEMVKDMLQFMASQRDKTVQLNNNNNTLQVLNK